MLLGLLKELPLVLGVMDSQRRNEAPQLWLHLPFSDAILAAAQRASGRQDLMRR